MTHPHRRAERDVHRRRHPIHPLRIFANDTPILVYNSPFVLGITGRTTPFSPQQKDVKNTLISRPDSKKRWSKQRRSKGEFFMIRDALSRMSEIIFNIPVGPKDFRNTEKSLSTTFH
ncbi:hypothetical protein MKMG_01797 [Methanogenium sp. MK-MG]|nr:hypothetical protein MKMG_01797 [Methanogenium sp. MK-MG]